MMTCNVNIASNKAINDLTRTSKNEVREVKLCILKESILNLVLFNHVNARIPLI